MFRTFDLDKVKEIRHPSKLYDNKDSYGDTLVDLIFNDGTVLTIAGHVKLPYSIDLVTRVNNF